MFWIASCYNHKPHNYLVGINGEIRWVRTGKNICLLAFGYKLGIAKISHTSCQPSKEGFYYKTYCSHIQKRRITSQFDCHSLCFLSCYSKMLDLNKGEVVREEVVGGGGDVIYLFIIIVWPFWFGVFWVPWSLLLYKFGWELKVSPFISQSIAMEMKGIPEILAFCICWLIQKREKVEKTSHIWWSRGEKRDCQKCCIRVTILHS